MVLKKQNKPSVTLWISDLSYEISHVLSRYDARHSAMCILLYMFLQGEMQQLKDKLAIAERAAKAEAQLKVRK